MIRSFVSLGPCTSQIFTSKVASVHFWLKKNLHDQFRGRIFRIAPVLKHRGVGAAASAFPYSVLCHEEPRGSQPPGAKRAVYTLRHFKSSVPGTNLQAGRGQV